MEKKYVGEGSGASAKNKNMQGGVHGKNRRGGCEKKNMGRSLKKYVGAVPGEIQMK